MLERDTVALDLGVVLRRLDPHEMHDCRGREPTARFAVGFLVVHGGIAALVEHGGRRGRFATRQRVGAIVVALQHWQNR